ncbi:MAG: quinolinate synthase NadA [Myxococcales bacterium]|nr:quinolinate synthase NadA [Myxococcales bacterium]
MGSFPSLRITADAFLPEGTFAEAQARYLRPDPALVKQLAHALREKKIGVVAHFYMDPELQGVLSAAHAGQVGDERFEGWPHVHVSDSLVMADRAVAMAEAGCEAIVVLGVDFMSENARAMLDAGGFPHVPVYRVAAEPIGCSLAESAESAAYDAYLDEAARAPRPLHVVYINTSLVTKAKAHAKVPTLTCTSSNVVQSVLQAAAQIEGVNVFFGPDTYMGENLRHLFEALAGMDDDAIRAVHPAHDAKTIASLLERFHYFEQGNCIVHHMFGAEVTETTRREYPDAFVTAHLEVPGEMFHLGLEHQLAGKGVVGSTADILRFITTKVRETVAAADPSDAAYDDAARAPTLRFVLGTEAGMITPIVREVQALLAEKQSRVACEIIFPVASEAVAPTGDVALPIVPGVRAGEGCTTAGGCATCPYMKMNSLDALLDVVAQVGEATAEALAPFEPKKYVERIGGRTAADLGGEPILFMRHFSQRSALPDALVAQIEHH